MISVRGLLEHALSQNGSARAVHGHAANGKPTSSSEGSNDSSRIDTVLTTGILAVSHGPRPLCCRQILTLLYLGTLVNGDWIRSGLKMQGGQADEKQASGATCPSVDHFALLVIL